MTYVYLNSYPFVTLPPSLCRMVQRVHYRGIYILQAYFNGEIIGAKNLTFVTKVSYAALTVLT